MPSLAEVSLDEQYTRSYVRRRFHRCPTCRSQPLSHEVRNAMSWTRDGMVFCTWCDTYLGVYDAVTELLLFNKERYV